MVSSQRSKTLTHDDLVVARDKWLKGSSLVQIAQYFGVTPSVIHYRLKKQFGNDVCSPKVNSLVRGLVRDGYELDAVREMPPSDQFYSSHRRDKVYTSHQDTRGNTIMDNMAAPEPADFSDDLRLPLTIYLLDLTTNIIGAIQS